MMNFVLAMLLFPEAMRKAQRELDRERTKLEQQEKKLVMDIKRSAKSGQLVRR